MRLHILSVTPQTKFSFSFNEIGVLVNIFSIQTLCSFVIAGSF